MKKIGIVLALVLASMISMGQIIRPNPTTNSQQFGSATTITRIKGLMYPEVGYAPALYTDTTAMNETYLKNVPLAEAGTIDGKTWRRNYATDKWEEFQVGPVSGGGTVTSFSSGNLSPLFTTSVATATTTPALSFSLSTQSANQVFAGPTTGGAAAPTFRALVAGDITGLVTTPTWQQTLTAGSTLTTNNTVQMASNRLYFENGGGTWYFDLAPASGGGRMEYYAESGSGGTFKGVGMDATPDDIYITAQDAVWNRTTTIGAGAGGTEFGDGTGVYLSDAQLTGLKQSVISVRYDEIRIKPQEGKILLDSIQSGASTDSLLVWNASTGYIGKRPVSGLTVPLSSLTAATGTNSINNAAFKQTWVWDTYSGFGTSEGVFNISGTAGASTYKTLFNISSSGANTGDALTSVGQVISVTNTRAASGTNIGLDITASGATTNNLHLLLREPAASGTNYTAFKTVAQAADIVYSLPPTVGGAGTVLTDVAGNGVLTWAAGATGNVTKVGTPVNNQIGIWTGDGTIEGDVDLTFDGTDITTNGSMRLEADLTASAQTYIGKATDGNFGGLWFAGNATTPTTSNYTFLYDPGFSLSVVNAPSGGAINFRINNNSSTGITIDPNNNMYIRGAYNVTAGAYLQIAAGTAGAGTAPFKLTSGTLNTTAEVGAVEFLTDKYYATITTGAARKELTLNDAALTSGTTPVATTNGRLTDGLILASGSYTPTLTNTTNVAASTAYSCQYMRVGNTVTVSGQIDIDVTLTATSTVLGISLPIASAIANANELGGTAYAPAIATMGAALLGDATNDRATLQFISSDVNNNAMYFSFTYRIL